METVYLTVTPFAKDFLKDKILLLSGPIQVGNSTKKVRVTINII